MPGLCDGKSRVEIVGGDAEIAKCLALRLADHGAQVKLVTEATPEADAVIYLGGLGHLVDDEQAMSVNREAFQAAKTVAAKFERSGGVFVTVQQTGGDFGLSGAGAEHNVWTSGLPGLVKTAGKEWPKATVKAIDLDCGDNSANDIAECIVTELLQGGPEQEVGLSRAGQRITLVLEAAAAPEGELAIGKSDCLLVSGGGRGVTAAAILALARECQPRLIILGRTPIESEPDVCIGIQNDALMKRKLLEQAKSEGRSLTAAELGKQVQHIVANRELQANLEASRQAGSEVVYVAVDVQQKDALEVALQPIREKWGAITGIVHGAGVLADKVIADKSMEQFNTVFSTKVNGMKALLEVTQEDPLKLICLFSSVAARSGNVGQSDYAMANEILNKAAHRAARLRGESCLVKSINWGPWDGGMVHPGLKKHFEQMGVSLIPLKEGTDAFVKELHSPIGSDREVVIGGGLAEHSTLIEGAYTRNWQMDIHLHLDSAPYLADHRIYDKYVIPAVLVMEWFAQAASGIRPELRIGRFSELSVKKGIMLDELGREVYRIHALESSESLASALIQFELMDESGRVCYTGEIAMTAQTTVLADHENRGMSGFSPDALALQDWDGDIQQCYGDLLFHGPQFQVLLEILGISDQGIGAKLQRPQETRRAGGPWITDPIMIDGGMQLFLIWGHRILGKRTLPTKIGTYVPGCVGKEPVYVYIRGERNGAYKITGSMLFLSEDWETIAEFHGVEFHSRLH
ncbi:SDR family oxidoreductase [Paenibacillus eucommiae]|uniref:NAD(P)-dependent dehydrogenase (Short-subunit alcohol dehydrogenase family) n=1 Tax=Paenibacillus eucommiae TaxID=1355755 RepID=A0ABS4IVP4_9BACL|nr:SDR family oxidoreductase [Paenibacillus eucommiae]MBP1991653.1 NAD(P)-dependent dehydrogenase (short-subunit alcohol dehydrogenase family) [Paenibacillus eucommiae]